MLVACKVNTHVLKITKTQAQVKLWFKFVETFGQMNVEINSRKLKTLSEIYKISSVRTGVFYKAASSCFTLSLLEERINKHQFTIPTGNAEITSLNWDKHFRILEGIKHIPYSKQVLWTFEMEKHLRINLTFHLISFLAGKFHHCKLGSLQVKDMGSKKAGDKYCGMCSHLINYPDYVKVLIQMDISFMATTNVNMFFSVIDKMVVISKNTLRSKKSHTPVWHIAFIQIMRVIKYFHIQTSKLKFLLLPHDVSVDIFDGPGPLSPKLKTVNQAVTSTFQCVVIAFITQKVVSKQIQFSSKNHIFLKHQPLSPTGQAFISFNECYKSNIAIHGFDTSPNLQINLTVLNLGHSSPSNHLCHHAGVSALGEQFQEVYLECQNKVQMFRSTYSTSSSVILVLYCYPEYTSFNISLKISTTKCQIKRENTCFYNWRCPFTGRAYCSHANERYTKLKGDIHALQYLDINRDKCVVVQFRFEMNADLVKLVHHRVVVCAVYFSVNQVADKTKFSLATQVRALLHGEYHIM